MVITAIDYQDFLTITNQFNKKKATIFYSFVETTFQGIFITKDNEISIVFATADGLPSTFNTDFPQAILLSNGVGVSG